MTFRVARLAVPLSCLVAATAAFGFARRYAVNWIVTDDLLMVGWLNRIADGSIGPLGLWDLWDNQHPMGAQVAAMWLLRKVFGLDFKVAVYTSFAVISGTAVVAAKLIGEGRTIPTRVAIVLACFALCFHPTQMEHLLWAFELGWFTINGCVVANIALIERYRERALLPAGVLCAIATFCSAQGAWTWWAVALHCLLLRMPPRLRFAAMAFALCGTLAVARIATHSGAVDSLVPTGADPGTLAVFFVDLFGGIFAARRHASLLVLGVSLLLVIALAGVRLLRRGDSAPFRAGLVLIVFSMLCVGSFAKGRVHLGIDWATTSFHAAPLLVPLLLGLLGWACALLTRDVGPRPADRMLALFGLLLLICSVVSSSSYGLTRARLWAMERAFAVWATCHSDLPFRVKARAAQVQMFATDFEAALPTVRTLCSDDPADPRIADFTRLPPLFAAMASAHPSVRAALLALWQDYATDLSLQLLYPPGRSDTPERLLGFAKDNVTRRYGYDPEGLAPFAAVYEAL